MRAPDNHQTPGELPQTGGIRHRFDDHAPPTAPGWVEVELKFDVDAADAWRLLETSAPSEPIARRELHTIYFDTPDAVLRRNGMVLRIRDDGISKVQAVKSRAPGGAFQRGEWETEVKTLAPDFQALAATPLAAVWAAKVRPMLKPAFEVHLKRASQLIAVGDAIIEVVFDEGEVRRDGRVSPIRELELELKSGPLEGLLILARRLSSEATLDLSFTTKADRGYALFTPPPSPASSLNPKTSAAQAFCIVALAALKQMALSARDLRGEPDAKRVHQLRVGVRRLRSAMAVFGQMLNDNRATALKSELKWLSGELSPARDLDVLITDAYAPFAAGRPQAPGVTALGEDLSAARKTAYRRVSLAVGSARFRALMLEAALWIEFGAWRTDVRKKRAAARDRPMGKAAASIIERRLRKLVRAGGDLRALSPSARHHLRIGVKKLRYACEFFAGLELEARAKTRSRSTLALAHDLADLQDALGVLNDIATACALGVTINGAADLITACQSREAGALRTADKVWRRVAAHVAD